MPSDRLLAAHRLLDEAVRALADAVGPGAGDADLLAALTVQEGATRRLDRIAVAATADLIRRGAFAERGYRSPVSALADLLGCERFEARRLVLVAEQVADRVGLDGSVLPPRLPATAIAFEAGTIGMRHVEVVARVLDSPPAQRLHLPVWAAAEEQLAARAAVCTPSELHTWGASLVEALDQDGAEPDDRRPPAVNELRVTRRRGAPGGTLTGRFDDAAMFDAIATVLDTGSRPVDAADERTPAQRNAAALADACGYVLDHGNLPRSGGQRPHLHVLVRLEDLEARVGDAVLDLGFLDFGGRLTPEGLRLLACDAAVVPIVLGGEGQPLDVGRATRTIPDGLRRAVIARDRGCARCGRPPSWCEVHHVLPWQHHGETELHNLVLLCRACHRLVHHAGWTVRLVAGCAEFTPPAWIDPERRPRRGPPRVVDLDAVLITAGRSP